MQKRIRWPESSRKADVKQGGKGKATSTYGSPLTLFSRAGLPVTLRMSQSDYLTASFSLLPGLNLGTRASGILISCRV